MKSLNREILRLSVPAILSNITMPLLSLTDTTICGHLGSSHFIGAVAVGGMMLNVVFWLFGFLRMGTTGLTAQAFGRQDLSEQQKVLIRALAIAFTFGALIVALQMPLRELLTILIAPGSDILPLAHRYFDICIWGAPALMGSMAMLGWLLGTQTTLLPMISTISVNVINVCTSVVLSMCLGYGFEGVAVGTLVANWCGLFINFLLVSRRLRGQAFWPGIKAVLNTAGLSMFFRVNSDIFFRSACILGVSMTVTAIGARLGAETLAVNAILVQFYIFFSYFMDGFAFTGEALCGRYYGAHDAVMLHRSMVSLLKWSAAMALIFLSIYWCFGRGIVALITDAPELIDSVMDYRLWLVLTPPLSVMAFIYDGFYIGITATRRMLVVTAVATIVFFAICFVHSGGLGLPSNNVMWAAFMSYLFLRGVLLAVMAAKAFKLPDGKSGEVSCD